MNKILILFFVLFSLGIAQETKEDRRIIETVRSDTIYVPISVDTLKVTVINKEIIPKQSWWNRNEGTLLGSFLAALIAIISILATNHINRKNTNIKEINSYTGLWCAVYSETFANEKSLRNVASELKEVESFIIENKAILFDAIPTRLLIDFLKTCRIEVLKFGYYDLDLHTMLSRYITSLEILLDELNFKRLKEIISSQEFDDRVINAIKEYINSVVEHIKELYKWQLMLRDMINSELKRLTGSGINIHKTNESSPNVTKQDEN